ncbi:MAG: C/D box methylation guide ribonucleoprotein complex aNOP56 subunit, partial [Ignisphaera sp.]
MSGRIFIADTALGIFALDEAGEIVEKVLYPKDIGRVVEELLPLAEGRVSSSMLQLIEILKTKIDLGKSTLVFEDPDIAREVAQKGFSTDVAIASEPVYRLRRDLAGLAVKLGLFKDEQEFLEYIHTVSLELTRRKLRRYAQKRDLLAVQAIRAIDDI